jgi:hypothetical protein
LQKLASATITDRPQLEQKRGVSRHDSTVEGELGIAKPDCVTVGEHCLRDALAADISAVLAAEIFEMKGSVRRADTGVMA